MLCLTMVSELASGQTRRAMRGTLEIENLLPADTEKEVDAMNAGFRERAGAVVKMANAIWIGQDARIDAQIVVKLAERYQAELQTVDFTAPQTIPRINAWVSEKTSGKIGQIVDKLPAFAALLALNAVYFKGAWVQPFRRALTADAPFTSAGRQTRPVPMMAQVGTYAYFEDETTQMATLRYKGGFSMQVLLPAEKRADEFLATLSSGTWDRWRSQQQPMEGTIRMPRFKLEYRARLRQTLSALGMGRAFVPEQAEFAGVQTSVPPVWIDEVIHRATAEVNEEGTEASAATAVKLRFGSVIRPKPERTFAMIVDRPFLAVITDDATGTILFLGWVGEV